VFSPFSDSADTVGIRREGEDGERSVNIESIFLSISSSTEEQDNDEEDKFVCVGIRTHEEVRYVYESRKKQNEGSMSTVSLVSSSSLSSSTSTPEIPSSCSDLKYTSDIIPLPSPPSLMALRSTSRSNTGFSSDRYGFPHDIAQFVSYSNISPTHGAFIVSLDSITLCYARRTRGP
jgi:hypothetical protein